MKTFVTDNDYQITLNDDGSFDVLIPGFPLEHLIYNPNKEKPWTCIILDKSKEAETIIGLVSPYRLRMLNEALKVIGKQDLLANEIEFINSTEFTGTDAIITGLFICGVIFIISCLLTIFCK